MDHKRISPQRVSTLDRARRFGEIAAHRLSMLLHAIASPAVVISAMLLCAAGFAVAGVWLLAGTAWAFIAAAVVLFALAAIALRGMTNG